MPGATPGLLGLGKGGMRVPLPHGFALHVSE